MPEPVGTNAMHHRSRRSAFFWLVVLICGVYAVLFAFTAYTCLFDRQARTPAGLAVVLRQCGLGRA